MTSNPIIIEYDGKQYKVDNECLDAIQVTKYEKSATLWLKRPQDIYLIALDEQDTKKTCKTCKHFHTEIRTYCSCCGDGIDSSSPICDGYVSKTI